MQFDSWVLDSILYLFFFLVLREGRVVLGREKASLFLWGSILWTGVIENLMVILGGYDYFAYASHYRFGGQVIEGYAGWFAFLLFVPLCICLGWFLLSLPAFVIADRLLGQRNIWLKATFAAATLVSFDMLLDPISVVNEWWRWTSPGYYLRGVTVSNYIGWFFLLFFFGAVFERTVIQRRGFAWLARIERLIFRADTRNLSAAAPVSLGRIFYFRLAAFLPVFLVSCMAVSTVVTLLAANNWGPFDSVFPNEALTRYFRQP
ncbi:MAG: carotenoid biosynthesis protein [bacterium]